MDRLYLYEVANIRVIDGDTVDCDIDLGFDSWLHKQRIRLFDIDAPETRTRTGTVCPSLALLLLNLIYLRLKSG